MDVRLDMSAKGKKLRSFSRVKLKLTTEVTWFSTRFILLPLSSWLSLWR